METVPKLLLFAWLLPLASFTLIVIGYSVPQFFGVKVRYETQKFAAFIAIGAIVGAFLLSATALFRHWLPAHPLVAAEHGGGGHAAEGPVAEPAAGAESHAAEHNNEPPPYLANDWYNLGVFGKQIGRAHV